MWNIVRSSVIGAVVLLAGCAEQQQLQPAPSASSYIPHFYTGGNYPAAPTIITPSIGLALAPRLGSSSFSLTPQAEAAPAPAPYVPPPRIAPPQPDPAPAPSATPADSSCGWWDPCHLWQH
jgi:hypothetical protein